MNGTEIPAANPERMSNTLENKQIFRQKSLDHVSSPEDLNSYIRVANPGTWILLTAIIILLAGALIWGAVVHFETRTVNAAAVVKNGMMSLYFTEEGISEIEPGMTVKIAGDEYELPELDVSAVKLFESDDSAIIEIIGADTEEYAYVAKLGCDLPNGVYKAVVAAEQVTPTGLIIN